MLQTPRRIRISCLSLSKAQQSPSASAFDLAVAVLSRSLKLPLPLPLPRHRRPLSSLIDTTARIRGHPARPAMAAAQPEWRAPPTPSAEVQERLPKLSVYNSLTRTKTPFVPLDPNGKKVGWYACGPTVYDDSHLGHARNYVSQDIIRRIMSDYLGFHINFVMNITDVDDKIILAGREQYLLAEFLQGRNEIDDELRRTTSEALKEYVNKKLPKLESYLPESENFDDVAVAKHNEGVRQEYQNVIDGKSEDGKGQPGDKEAKIKMHLNTVNNAVDALHSSHLSLPQFVEKASGVLRPYIDRLNSSKVSGKDHHIFTKLTKKYEQRFFEDMQALNVRYPDKVTRVTEYGPQIVDFVKQIQDNGYAYENEGSVYYDTTSWESSGGHYARLEPWNRNDSELQADGEGSLAAKKTSFKKSSADFALWKASKAGEPSWESPWGEGRPGWHIECSAMASDVLGKQFDIHSGGIDLAFPHHDNELAQSEAYWHKCGGESEQWVNYFLHMGHLSISGSKMSKSLKNFTTIKDALSRGDFTPRSLRIIYLLGNWRDGLEITPDLRKASVSWEGKVDNFFLKVRDLKKNPTSEQTNGTNGTKGAEADLGQLLEKSKERFREAILDSFDTPAAMRILSELITAYNSASHVPDTTSEAIGEWITQMVVMFGLDAGYRKGQMGWSGIDIPEKAKPFIEPLSQLRDKIREQAIKGQVDLESLGRLEEKDNFYRQEEQPYAKANADFQRKVFDLHKSSAASKDYLAAADDLRDNVLWNLGIYLEDRANRPALVRPLSESLRQERQEQEARAAEKAAAKEKAKADAAAKEKERLEKGKVPPQDLFKTDECKAIYSEWDDKGMPVKDKEGKDVAKSQLKKLTKLYENQKKLHESWLAAQK